MTNDFFYTISISLVSFIGMAIIYFLKLLFTKVENIERVQQNLKIDVEILKDRK